MLKRLITPWQARWQTLAVRDRQALCVMGIVLVATLFYMLIWQPTWVAQREAKARYGKERELYSYISTQAMNVQSTPAAQLLEPAQLRDVLTELAAGFAIDIERIDANALGEIELNLSVVTAESLVKWLDAIAGKSIEVRRAELTQGPSGQLSAMLVLGVME